jgi:hypothetical protein
MRLYIGKVSAISDDVIKSLMTDGDLEVDNAEEARLDIESVLKEYVRRDKDVGEEAKNRMEARGLGYSQLGKVKAQVAKERGIQTGEDTLPYLIEQILEMLFHSQHVIEIFADDTDLRKKMAPILRKHMDVDDQLDVEVRGRIKNLEEGTAAFDIEYAKVMEQMRRKKGLT